MPVRARQDGKRRKVFADAQALVTDLRAQLIGEVRFDPGSRALYATDASNYRQVPIGVVIPRTLEDVVAAVSIAHRHHAPILLRGGGTSLAGQACNVALVIDTSKHLHRVLELDPAALRARVQPGVVCDVLCKAAERHGLTFGPDPSTHNRCTLGGMIGNNACGAHSVMAGKTAENIESLEVLTYDGERMTVGPTSITELERILRAGGRRAEIYAGLKNLSERYAGDIRRNFPQIRRRVSGYNLDALLPENGFHVARALVGSEGTCAVTLTATVRLLPSSRHRVLLVLGYPDICVAGDRAPALVACGALSCEGLDERVVNDMRVKQLGLEAIQRLPAGQAWLLAEFGAETLAEAEEHAQAAWKGEQAHASAAKVYAEVWEQRMVWSIRESGAAANNAVPGEPETYPGWEDAAVDPARVGDYLRDYRKLLAAYGYRSSLYGHFGDGCIHGRVTFDLLSGAGLRKWRAFLEKAADLVVAYGGSLSGEHGDGQARAELLPRMFSPAIMQAFAEFKGIWDPDQRMNPGKLVHPLPLDANLRTGPGYHPAQPTTVFTFHRDEGSFARAAGRCVGVAQCRRYAGGTMCPSYRATLEERHSTRGRARLLFEMLREEPVGRLWDSQPVRESLDLCLSCKGCRHECPVQVDMATYKAEFLYHYYRHHRRPRQAYSMGRIHQWARLAGHAPALVNALTRTPGLSRLAKSISGIASERRIPEFAPIPFTRRFNRRHADTGATPWVVLWPDTFNNYFHPETAWAAVAVLEAAGYAVSLPAGFVCCGRPLYDFGWLDAARRRLQQTLQVLAQEISAGIPIVVLEPSCMATFRDELLNFFPRDATARRFAAQTYLLSEFLIESGRWRTIPRLSGHALVHGHCHQKALMGMQCTQDVLARSGLEVTLLDSGCCGMAGAFGYEPDKYPISMRVAEEVLLPAVREAAEDTLIVADGFSCREQVRQATGCLPLHTADVLCRGLGGAAEG